MTTPDWNRIRDEYRHDGVAVVRGVIASDWLARVAQALEEALVDRSALSADRFDAEGRRFHNGFFHWQRHEALRQWALDSVLPEIAAQVLESPEIRFFYDQTMIKEPGVNEPTPWHQDLTYWPLTGDKVLTIWVPFDTVDMESGAVVYARGSHLRAPLYGAGPGSSAGDSSMPAFPDMSLTDYGLLAWNTQPGDCIVHHPRVLHMAGPNRRADRRRRATAMRYVGDNVCWQHRGNDMFQELRKRFADAPHIGLGDGEPLDHPQFPRVWPRPGL